MKSNFVYDLTEIDNDAALLAMTSATNKTLTSAHVNAMWSPTPKTRIGLEYIFAERELKDGSKGDLSRVHRYDI